MATLGNPKEWISNIKSKECTQEICSLSCPQWCYIIFPPPPPLAFPDDQSQSNQSFSPLVIAIIGILASALLLASYYAIISKYCGNSESSRRDGDQSQNEETFEDIEGGDHNDHDPSRNHEPWFVRSNGLDEALIKTITLVKYKKGDGLIGSGDCSVCLGEFLEDDSLRLLPKCNHAFHVACIDTWLKSHSNCPLCRANIFSISHPQAVQLPLTSVIVENNAPNQNNSPQDHGSSSQNQVVPNEGIDSSREGSRNLLKNPFRTFSDIGSSGTRKANTHQLNGARVDEENVMRRSISMDHCKETEISISRIVRLHREGDCCQIEKCQLHDDDPSVIAESSSKSCIDNAGSNSSKSGVLQSVMSSVTLKRSFSSGRFLFSKHSRGSNAINPV